MKVGVFSDIIAGDSPEQIAERSRAAGIETVQLRLDWPGLDLAGTAADRTRVRRAYESAGVEVAAIAAYTNLFDPHPERRNANRASLKNVIGIAQELGTKLVVTETGSYSPDDLWSDHPRNHGPDAWAELLTITLELVQICEKAGVVIAYEPYVNTVLSSALVARRLADAIPSPALSFVFDGAGLVTPETVSDNRAITDDATTLLHGRIALAHADDVRYVNGKAQWLPLGWGGLDAGAVFDGLANAGFDGALIVEHLKESLVPEALAFCRREMVGQKGVTGTRE